MHIYAYAGGHYIAYCQNVINGQWYEFDDQYVTEVHETVVQNAEAYVLFYRWVIKSHVKCNPHWLLLHLLTVHTGRAVRSQCGSGRKLWPWPIWRSPACCSFTSPENGWTSSTPLLNPAPSATTHFFVNMEVCSWETHQVNTDSLIQRLMGFLCTGIPPNKYQYIDDLVVIVPQNVWEYLYNRWDSSNRLHWLSLLAYLINFCLMLIDLEAVQRWITSICAPSARWRSKLWLNAER